MTALFSCSSLTPTVLYRQYTICGPQKALLREKFGDGKWECSRILDELDRTTDLYFDRVSQIRMECRSQGRIVLLGDAAFCVSLMAGQGAALAMTAAYVLAGELGKANGRHEEAFRDYEKLLLSRPSGRLHCALQPPLRRKRV
jgi:2-polyprenyl-6-methoxyphenol hydroxylase-like FAD-dependent oxidoreductase